ncbi:MAG: hypothetical protein LBQ61_09765 [Spirochaetales bacterium]|jgi:hypothetical protein|nr:hypothetical protein [Spirochaetales bacterium]
MLGLADVYVVLSYYILVLSALGCVIYGTVFWNRGRDISETEILKEKSWMKEKLALDREVSGEENEG